MDYEEKKKQAG
jgi:hypothetical protein